ncbi:MAG: tetratricopeptide repeat protein [Chloroflexota bacterium]|nr:tetratricopeptide repeat protein [Chloroflexota bacterium]
MMLDDRLNMLRGAGLIRDAGTASEKEYLFQHALLQEAAYDSLLKQDRKRLHLAVGDALEQLYPDRLEELAPRLARHFQEAADDPRALTYFILAGEHALRQYAFPEVIAHYTSALAIAQQIGAPLAKLYRARGLAYEGHGEYERARADQEAALAAAQVAQDRLAEWQALIDLGKAWSERDYGKAGEYFQQAFDLAGQTGDPATLAHSLNRMGNWYVNVERPQDALRQHRQALAIFEQLEDRRGIAQTNDLLGMTNSLGGDLIQAETYYRRAIALFRELDERVDLASSQTSLALGAAEYQVGTAVFATPDLATAQRDVEQALQIARESGWRSAEAFALIVLAGCQGSCGESTQALDSVKRAFEIAAEIGHRQWMTYAHGTLGMIYADLFAAAAAREHLEQALTLAIEIGSWHWTRTMAGFLASVCISHNDLERAQAVLEEVPAPQDPPQTLGQRLVYCARAELALARGEPVRALEIIDQLIASAANAKPDGSNILRVSLLRGQALAVLGRFDPAEAALIAARDIADAQGARPMLWRIHAALGKFDLTRRRRADSDRSFAAARAIVDQLAENIADESLRKNFQKGAHGLV